MAKEQGSKAKVKYGRGDVDIEISGEEQMNTEYQAKVHYHTYLQRSIIHSRESNDFAHYKSQPFNTGILEYLQPSRRIKNHSRTSDSGQCQRRQ
jgi:hypothetical protein